MGIATKKTFENPARTASKKIVQKSAEATGHIGNKIGDKINSIGKSKIENIESQKNNETQDIYKPLEKRKQIIDNLRLI